jgi:hypothetical protein
MGQKRRSPNPSQDTEHPHLDSENPLSSELAKIYDSPVQLSFVMRNVEGLKEWSHVLYHGPQGENVRISYCKTLQKSEAVAKRMLNCKVLGFDIEWNWRRGSLIGENVSLIQLASEKEIGLFHIAQHSGSTADEILAPSLKAILESSSCIKAGVGISGDGNRLVKYLQVVPHSFLDMDHLAKLTEPQDKKKERMSLSGLVDIHLGLPLNKDPKIRRSKWSAPLSPRQLEYAAADAYAGFMLFDCLNKKRIALSPPTPLPEFVTIKAVQGNASTSSSQDDMSASSPSSQASVTAARPSKKRKATEMNPPAEILHSAPQKRRA